MTTITAPDGFGIVVASCTDHGRPLTVPIAVGRWLRQGSEAYLCFDCGPAGSVYHPEGGRCLPGDHEGACDCRIYSMDDIRRIAKPMVKTATRVEIHKHTVTDSRQSPTQKIEHSHAKGEFAHRHPTVGPATFVMGAGWRAMGYIGGGDKKFTPKPTGQQLDYIETPEAERRFRVVFTDRAPWSVIDGVEIDQHGERVTDAERTEWESSRAVWLECARTGGWPVGPSAIPMAAHRMRLTFDMVPVVVVQP